MRIDDALLEKLGTYFVYHNIHEKYGVTFEHFIQMHVGNVDHG